MKDERFMILPGAFGRQHFMRIPIGDAMSVKAAGRVTAPFLQEIDRLRAGMECNLFELEKFSIENGTITLDAEISMTTWCKDIQMRAQLYDIRDESKPLAIYEMQEAKETDDMHYTISSPLAPDVKEEELEVVISAQWQDETGAIGAAAIKENAAYDVAQWNVIYPKVEEKQYLLWQNDEPQIKPVPDKEKRQDGKIMLALFREPDQKKDLDYLCEYGKDVHGRPIIMVPGQGKLVFTDPHIVIQKDSASLECYLKKINQGGVQVVAVGSHEYKMDQAKFTYTAKSISYQMYNSWGVGFVESGSFQPHEFSYRIKLTYKREGVKTLRTLWLADEVDHKRCIQSVPHIMIMWGCVEERTQIRMADGTQKEIRNIKIGEKVLLADGEEVCVENVWRGSEENWYLLRTKSGMEIKADDTHPFLTKAGMVLACHLHAGDAVMVWDDQNSCMREEVLTSAERREMKITVCNLSLGGKRMIANGFVCGDMELQNAQECR